MEIRVFKKYLFNFIALVVLVLLTFLIGVKERSLNCFNVEGYFSINETFKLIGNGLTAATKNINVYSLIVYLVPMIFVIFFIIYFICSLARGKWSPFFYILTTAILTGIFLCCGAIIYSILVNPETGALYEAQVTHFKTALFFKNINFSEVDFSNSEQLKTFFQAFGYDLVLWLILVTAAVSLISYITVCGTYVAKAARKKVYYPTKEDYDNKNSVNYYYVSNYYTHPGAKAPTSSDVKKVEKTSNKKNDKDYVYPEIKKKNKDKSK